MGTRPVLHIHARFEVSRVEEAVFRKTDDKVSKSDRALYALRVTQ
jgi:hypothetical protein